MFHGALYKKRGFSGNEDTCIFVFLCIDIIVIITVKNTKKFSLGGSFSNLFLKCIFIYTIIIIINQWLMAIRPMKFDCSIV